MTVRVQLFRFALVGVVNTGTYYACYLSLLYRLPYVVSHILAFLLSMIGSFFLNSRFTYRTRPTWRKFLLFPLTNAANFVITTSGVYLLVDVLHLGSRYAPLIAAAAAVPVTFVVSRTIMLRPDRATRVLVGAPVSALPVTGAPTVTAQTEPPTGPGTLRPDRARSPRP
ncbi:GtrA family protein [Streptomyces sp. NPDC002018]|uniref:GtrA family protein n=1 Tax=Streptomyces sp. NPDC002018 TaxID=3364629 RepID=UPI0036CE64F5